MKALVGTTLGIDGSKGMIRKSTILMVLTLLLAGVPCAITGQESHKPDSEEPSKVDSTKKPPLTDAVRVSTDDALKNVARQKAANKDASSKVPSGDAVWEFHEAPPSAVSPGGSALSKDSKRSPLKDIHGEAHGLAGAGANLEGGKVGGHSKDGKTSIYVETDHAGTSTSH